MPCFYCYSYNALIFASILFVTDSLVPADDKIGAVQEVGRIKFILPFFRVRQVDVNAWCELFNTSVFQFADDQEFAAIQGYFKGDGLLEYNILWVSAIAFPHSAGVKFAWDYGHYINTNAFFNQKPWVSGYLKCISADEICLIMRRDDSLPPLHLLEETCCEGEDENYFMCAYRDGYPSTPTLHYNESRGVLNCDSPDVIQHRVRVYQWRKSRLVLANNSLPELVVLQNGFLHSGAYECQVLSDAGILSTLSNTVFVNPPVPNNPPPLVTSTIHEAIQPSHLELQPSEIYQSGQVQLDASMSDLFQLTNYDSHTMSLSPLDQNNSAAEGNDTITGYTTFYHNATPAYSADASGLVLSSSVVVTSSTGSADGSSIFTILTVTFDDIGNNVKRATLVCHTPEQHGYIWYKNGNTAYSYFNQEIITVQSNDTNASGEYWCSPFNLIYQSNKIWLFTNIITASWDPDQNMTQNAEGTFIPEASPSSTPPNQNNIPYSNQTMGQTTEGPFPPGSSTSFTSPYQNNSWFSGQTMGQITDRSLVPESTPPSTPLYQNNSQNTMDDITLSHQSTTDNPGVSIHPPRITSTYYVISTGYAVKLSCLSRAPGIEIYVFGKTEITNLPTSSTTESMIYAGASNFFMIQNLTGSHQAVYSCWFRTIDGRCSIHSEKISLVVPPNGSLCQCPCGIISTTLLQSDLIKITSEIHRTLTIPTNNLSSTIRKKTSAVDQRRSSTAIGFVAILILTSTSLLFVVADANRFIMFW